MSIGFAKPRNPEHIPEHSLWVLRKNGKTAEARTRMVPVGPELRIYYNRAFLRSEVVGRAARADFIVDAHLVSRVHCRFTLSQSDELDVEDVGSTNGTFVNGKKILKTTLADGDKVKVGRVEFVARNSE